MLNVEIISIGLRQFQNITNKIPRQPTVATPFNKGDRE
jgi:hypothetical protein